ncbi:hypothetical protein F2P56_001031 [Juglans regia]|uniref:NAC domain-containing protein n=2 Tax=Juglans regia TaxID=51240 RepID=A0A833Y9B2_JUGRE|nr:NAC domain-containing protein 7-like [Juglans regia]KAF5480268.1 hypothetical protein F2P56_001031 [Juglans regia]
MNTFSHVPPGFRFHPTDEELVHYYLRKKVTSRRIDLDVIKDVDLYRIEPWDLEELCRIGTEEQNEWYFFSHKDKKYPTGTRTNRATSAGFWKATGRDKAIYSKHDLIGMRKTLVFYKGRAPNGQKSDWIMHEYRLETEENGTPQEEGWVVCRVFKKRITTVRKVSDHESSWYDDQASYMPDLDSPKQNSQSNNMVFQQPPYPCKKELDHLPYHIHPHEHFLQLPLLESPKLLHQPAATLSSNNCLAAFGIDINQATTVQSSSISQEEQNFHPVYSNNCINEQAVDQVTDWRVLDKFVASQLSQDHDHHHVSKENSYPNAANNNNIFQASGNTTALLVRHLEKQEMVLEKSSLSTSDCQIGLWK